LLLLTFYFTDSSKYFLFFDPNQLFILRLFMRAKKLLIIFGKRGKL